MKQKVKTKEIWSEEDTKKMHISWERKKNR